VTPPVPPSAAVEIAREALVKLTVLERTADVASRVAVAALAAAGLLDPDARLREAVAALRAKTDQHGGVPWLEPELPAVFAALDAAPAETGEQLAARLTDRMRARDAAGSGEA